MRWLCLLPSLSFAAFAYFLPPEKWNLVNPERLSASVEIGFISNENKLFKPSLNFTRETFSCSSKEYIEALKRAHTADRKNKWVEIGFVETRSGKAHVAQIDSRKEWGEVRLLQMVYFCDQTAYIITAVAMRDEFPSYHNLFLKTFASFWVGDSIEKSMTPEQKSALEKIENAVLATWTGDFNDKKFQKNGWVTLEKSLQKEFKPFGLHWQAHAAMAIRKKLLESPDPRAAAQSNRSVERPLQNDNP